LQAVRHLFRVTSSLDSLVVGESQILGQTKKSIEIARKRKTLGRVLSPLFQQAVTVAKEVHTVTGIAAGHVSIGSTAVDFARQIFASFEDKTVLMIGAGEMGELTLQHVIETKPKRILVTNRTASKAKELADKFGGEALPFEKLAEHLVVADIVISSTGAPEPIVRRRDLERTITHRRYRPMLLLDIAVPRDIEAEVGDLEQVFLYNVDDLQAIIESTQEQRRQQVARAEDIIEASVFEFAAWQDRRGIAPVVRALDAHLDEICEQELAWLMPKLTAADDHDEELIRQLMHRVSRKFMHGPKKALNDKADNGEAQVIAETLKTLFQLPDDV
jgi:glutamyl-tRNA reductase